MTTIRVEHLARIEGHGGITVELDGGSMKRVEFDIFEGVRLLEALVVGRDCEEVAPVLSRICAICSASHVLTSLKATEAALGVQVTPQTESLRELLLRGENIQSHALHFFCLALPDYLGYPGIVALAAERPADVELGLRLKKLGNLIQEIVGGRAVHPVNAVVGGFASLPSTEQLVELRHALDQGRADAEEAVELAASLPSLQLGRSPTAYAAGVAGEGYGYYGIGQAVLLDGTRRTVFAPSEYRRLTNERPVAHSHARYSAFEGKPFMVGALARLAIRGDRLGAPARRALQRLGLELPGENPLDNNKAQLVELVEDVEFALRVVDELLERGLRPEAPRAFRRRAGQGVALTEAPRGLLVHSYAYDEQGRLVSADVVTPTAINAASIEERFRAAIGQLNGCPPEELADRLSIVARAYDPCLSCSVHVLQARHEG
ncbi:MAG: Ni/Fe hydrogenase subunit alpha [Bryobacterales bacterium]|nr:Ni/Fe hydrogenase subunit alpha [Bryobacteraceae bacterium]MDW8131412.1 Ni/Fe hydrogenase subunit alpha [Bryobacterales bacterium]